MIQALEGWLAMHSRCAFIVAIAVLSAAASRWHQSAVRAAVEAYEAGEWHRAVDALDTRTLTAGQLTTELDAWCRAADGAVERQRRVVAAAFAVDVAWQATRSQWDGGPIRFGMLFAIARDGPLNARFAQGVTAGWAVRQLPVTGPVTATERALWMAAVGLAEDGGAWDVLRKDIVPRARKRLPDEPRLHLATVLAQVRTELGYLRLRSRQVRGDALREEGLPAIVTRRIPGAVRAFESLLADASLAGEVELHIGYLELRRRKWADALARFDAARAKTADPLLRATADYFEGWVHEQRNQPDEAIAAYRRAVTSFPTMRNIGIRLAALLFVRGERAEAYAILDRALTTRPMPTDFLISLDRGDSRFVADWLAMVRQGLRESWGS